MSASRILVLMVVSAWLVAGCSGAKKINVGGTCILNSDCNSPLVCTMGKCHDACHTSADCPTGQSCVKTDNSTICQLPAEGDCSETLSCSGAFVCASDQRCRTACQSPTDCASEQECMSGICHDACQVSADCAAGQSCLKTNNTTLCQLPADADCSQTLTCGGGFVCAPDQHCRTECQSRTDCTTEQMCVGGVCAAPSELDPNGQLPQKGPSLGVDGGTDVRAADAGVGDTGTCVAAPDGIVAWWTGNSTFESVVTPQYNAVGNGVTFVEGVVGNAFSFSGSGFATVASSPGLNLTSGLTIEGWIRPQIDGKLHVLAKWGDSGAWAHQREYSLHVLPGGALRFAIAGALREEDTSLHIFDTPAGVLPLASWSHIAATFDGSTGTRVVYVNGVEIARREDGPLALFAGGADLGIGAQMSAPGLPLDPFFGQIDEITLYSRPLTASEVQAIHLAGAAGKCRE